VWPRRQRRADDFLNQPDYGDRNDDYGYWDVHYVHYQHRDDCYDDIEYDEYDD
jgi:hypothetical protein